MNDSEKLAMAAHLHVALRRKLGRVTDTEWMAGNPEYGLAMVELALKHAEETMDQELGRLALRFGAALTLNGTTRSPAPARVPAPEADEPTGASWWDSRFGTGRSTRPAGAETRPASETSSATTWPSSSALGLPSAQDDESPMPLRRGRYVGGLR